MTVRRRSVSRTGQVEELARIRFAGLFHILSSAIPPGVNFPCVGIHGRLFFVDFPVNREAFSFPTADGALVTPQIRGNFLPGVQSMTEALRQAVRWLGITCTHERALRGRKVVAF